jgi:hypothetical protein
VVTTKVGLIRCSVKAVILLLRHAIKPELMKAVLLAVEAMVENLRSVKLAFKDWRPTKLAIEDRRLAWVAIVVEGIAAMVVLERVVIDTRMR